ATVTVPAKVLVPCRISVPGPAILRGLVTPPLMTPVNVALLATEREVMAARVTGPVKVAALALVPPRVGVPWNWTGLVSVRAAVGEIVAAEGHGTVDRERAARVESRGAGEDRPAAEGHGPAEGVVASHDEVAAQQHERARVTTVVARQAQRAVGRAARQGQRA